MATPVHILAVGARTPLGLTAAPAAAALRAGITLALGEHPFMVDQVGDAMPAAMDADLDPRIMGSDRLIALGQSAVAESSATLGKLGLRDKRLPVYLGLPEFRPGFTEQDAESVRSGIAALKGMPVQLGDVSVFPQGHASGASALAAAIDGLTQGVFEVCLVGGAESYFHPDTMEWLDSNRQLVGTVSRSGFIPGEGAAFCLLASEGICQKSHLASLARVDAVSLGQETKLIKTEEMCLGEGLSKTVQAAVGNLPRGEWINEIICDINGERYRGEEWGFVCLRLGQVFEDATGYVSPADCWGDMGAASIPLFAMLACQAARGGYAKGPRVLLWASSESGLRGAAVLQTNSQL